MAGIRISPRNAAAAYIAAASLFVFIGCGGKSEPSKPQAIHKTKGPRPEPRETRLRPLENGEWMNIAAPREDANSIELTVNVPAGTEIRKDPVPLVVCVPEAGNLRLKLIRFLKNGKDMLLPLSDANATSDSLPYKAAQSLSQSLELKRLGILRRWPMASLTLKKEFLDPVYADGKPTSATVEARLRIEWDEPADPNRKPPHPEELEERSAWYRVAERLVCNPAGLKQFQLDTPPLRDDVHPTLTDPRKLHPGADGNTRPWVRVRVGEEGLHRIDLKRLAEAGWSKLADKPDSLRLFHRGHAQPLIRHGQGDQREIYFWSERAASAFSKETIYWLTSGDDLPDTLLPILRQGEVPEHNVRTLETTLRTTAVDHDNDLRISYGDFRSVRAMRWVDSLLEPQVPIRIPLALDHPVVGDGATTTPITLTLGFYFELDALAHSPANTYGVNVTAAADGGASTSLSFMNDQETTPTFNLDPRLLHDGATTLTLTLEKPITLPGILQLWFDGIEARYASEPRMANGRLSLVADERANSSEWLWTPLIGVDPTSPPLLALAVPAKGEPEAEIQVSERGGKPGILRPGRPDLRVELFDPTAIPSADEFEPIGADDITAENQGADLLLIAHHDFLEGIAPLAEFHRSQGLRVHVTDVQSVYDTFSDGELSPLALRDFFAYTLTHWKQGAPTHILLAGDCSSDYLDYARKNVKNWVPTYDFEANWDRWASDEWMGLVAGKDALSDFMIGRISVNNTKDLDAVVQKYVHAGTDYPIGPWRARDILVADNEPEFPRLLDEFHQQNVPSAIETKRIFLNELPMEDNFYADDERRKGVFQEEGRWMKVSPAATEKLLAALTDGAGVLAYFGHGSPNVWSDERIWFGGDSVNSDNLHLSGMKKPPFVVNFTCNSGAIDYPIPQWNINIIEDMIRIENGGALAAFVPSGPGATGLQEALGNLMFKVIFRERPQTIGEIATLTRARFAATGLADEYVYMYILLGDPLLEAPLTAHVREFELPRDVYQPGEKIETTLAPVTPPEGKYLVQLESTRGETLWQSEPTTYGTGRIPVAVNLQSSLPTGKYAVRVYGWNEAARTDLAASAEFDAAYPEDEIATATLKSLGTKQTRIGVLVKNIGKLDSVDRRIELLALRDGSASPLGGKGYDVGAGKSVRLDFTVANSTDRTTPALKTAYEIRLLDTPPDSAKPRRVLQVKRIAPAGFEPPPYQGPDLRIAHNSIRLDPEKPSEGETIFVHFLVENEGDEPSALARATLLDGDPTSGGQPVYNHNSLKTENIPVEPIRPGDARDVTLRWDPVFNAGDRTFWIKLDPTPNGPPESHDERITSGTVHVRTKWKLGYKNVKASATEEDAKNNQMTLHADVLNEGETDVKNVSYAFYKGAKLVPENLIYEGSLEVVRAGETVPVDYFWQFKSRENLTDAEGNRGFRVQVWIKGTKLRISAPMPDAK